MKPGTIVALVLAGALLLAGIGVFCVAAVNVRRDAQRAADARERKSAAFDEPLDAIGIALSSDDLTVSPAEDGVCRVTWYENERRELDVRVQDGRLIVREKRTPWWGLVRLFDLVPDEQRTVTVALPAEVFREASMSVTSGNVQVTDLAAGKLTVTLTSGDLSLVRVSADAAAIHTTSGRIAASGIAVCGTGEKGGHALSTTSGAIAVSDAHFTGPSSLHATSGAIALTRTEADAELTVSATSGSVTLSDVNVHGGQPSRVETTSGAVTLERACFAGKAYVHTTSGRVSLAAADAAEWGIQTTSGNVTGSLLRKMRFMTETASGGVSVPADEGTDLCRVHTTSGSIRLSYE